MSEPGPSEHSSSLDRATASTVPHGHVLSSGDVKPAQSMSEPQTSPNEARPSPSSRDAAHPAPVKMRVHFDEFAAQLRLHRHGEYKRRMLEHRRTHLQKAVALSGRLRRLTSWLHDGLVEISKFPNTADFVRVHEHLLNLTDVCFSRWNYEVRAFDSVTGGVSQAPTASTFFSKLSHSSQSECLAFIRNVRSNPRFLVDRFKAVSSSQLVALSTAPRYADLGAYISSFSGSRGRSSQKKRIQSFAKNLEDYATTFERKNPMSFLLHNCYAVNAPTEDHLRIQTWSSICATLYVETGAPFLAFFHQILWEFSGLSGWRARDRLELFLMDTLQRGAFLLEPVGDIRKGALDSYIVDTLEGEQARTFFDNAVRELFEILLIEDGGFPQGVLDLTRAMLAKLPDEATQGLVRGYVVSDWFLQHFLANAITFPENQKMLLQFHISDSARSTILRELWQRAYNKAQTIFYNEYLLESDEELKSAVYSINNQLYAEAPATAENTDDYTTRTPSCISLCASDLIHTLEALSQQYISAANHFEPFMQYTASAFHSHHARTPPKLDKLRRELQLLFEPGHSSAAVHAADEQWMLIPLKGNQPDVSSSPAPAAVVTTASLFDNLASPDPAQKAAIRLALEDNADGGLLASSPYGTRPSLPDLILARERYARSAADAVGAHFWASALDHMDENYPLAFTPHAESRILRPLVMYLQRCESNKGQTLEAEVGQLENQYHAIKDSVVKSGRRIEHLKLKLWYVTSVVVSGVYENAQNITKALAYMWLASPPAPIVAYSASSDSRTRPGTSTSTTSSLFEQPRLDTMKILKAPKEHGGPKKLADEQIELTKRWLDGNKIENFCKGEERIHRFCMEIKMATRRLVAESAVESPDLWSSDLWAKEKHLFESGPMPSHGIAASTRPPSVVSDTPSSTPWGRPMLGSAVSSRSFEHDLASSPSGRWSAAAQGATWSHHGVPDTDLASSFAAPARSQTTASAESLWSSSTPFSSQARSQTSASITPSIWSQSSIVHPSRSQTSASFSSRAPSIYNEVAQLKLNDVGPAKAKFLDTVREGLTVLLLSDLGNPVWSLGSETDAWLDSILRNPRVAKRLSRRQDMTQLLPPQPSTLLDSRSSLSRGKTPRRSWSADDSHVPNDDRSKPETSTVEPDKRAIYELEDVLKKASRQVDPNAKLQAVHEFWQLALLCLDRQTDSKALPKAQERRQSLDPGILVSRLRDKQRERGTGLQARDRSEKDVRDYLRLVLHTLEPKTLFRDLQYIAAFTDVDASNGHENGKAFVQIGLAALSNKDNVCRAMVELADEIISKDGIKRQASVEDAEHPLNKARDYWIIAAKEGNAVAQRELASLYLAHPEISVPPTVTVPMSISSSVFRDDMMWKSSDGKRNRQALCLALHWMQTAAVAGDTIARQKLEDRAGKATE